MHINKNQTWIEGQQIGRALVQTSHKAEIGARFWAAKARVAPQDHPPAPSDL